MHKKICKMYQPGPKTTSITKIGSIVERKTEPNKLFLVLL